MSKIFFCVILIAKCLLIVPLCNSFITFWASMVNKHHLNLKFCPILYKTSLFIVKGPTLLANRCFCQFNKDFSICCVYKSILTSFNHFGFVKNMLAFVVCSRIPMGSIISSNLNKTFATT
jgi:hypothetical protein